MSNPTWQDITPQRTQPHEVACVADPCTDPEHDHEPMKLACNECGSEDTELSYYDFGTDEQTGYHDTGAVLICRNCGKVEQL